MRASDRLLRVHRILERSTANGPGTRAVVWVQGCTLNCSGCINPETHAEVGGEVWSSLGLSAHLLELRDLDGVTFSGGEPFQQAAGLAAVARAVRSAGLSVVCYSGHTYEELRASSAYGVAALLGEIDLLIDGRFVPAKAASLTWRGSTNQRLLALTDRYATEVVAALESEPSSSTFAELRLGCDGALTLTGFAPARLWRALQGVLGSGGDDDHSL